MKTLRMLLHAVLVFIWYVLKSVAASCLSGGLVFLVVVMVVAFAAWLAGVPTPRDPALTAGIIVGALWMLGEFSWRLWRFFEAFQDLWTKAQVEKVLDEDV